MNEFEDLKELLHEEDLEFNKTVEKNMNRKITKKVYKNIFVILFVVMIAISGFHFIIKATYFNPNQIGVNFEYLLQSYVWLYHPDVVYVPSFNSITQEGLFGKYSFEAEFDKRFEASWIGDNKESYEIDNGIDLSNLYAISPIMTNRYDRDKEYSYNHDEHEKEYLIEELKKLPESTYIDATFLFIDAIELDEIIDLMEKYKNTDFIWSAIEPYDDNQTLITGIPLQSSNIAYNEELEGFKSLLKPYENDIPTVEEMKTKYCDMMDVLLYHREVYELFVKNDVNRSYYHLNNQRAYVRENLKSIGVRIYTNKEDLIQMVEEENCSYVWIEDMKLSKLEK